MICRLLTGEGISCTSIPSSAVARTELEAGAGAVILAEEVLTRPDIAAWSAQLADQPPWSALPVIVLTVAGAVDRQNQQRELARRPMGNLVALERPVRPGTLVGAVQDALRSRHRQYQMREFSGRAAGGGRGPSQNAKTCGSPAFSRHPLPRNQQPSGLGHQSALPHQPLVFAGRDQEVRRGGDPRTGAGCGNRH